MSLRPIRFSPLLIVALAIGMAHSAEAQARPTAAEAQALLKARPELVSQLEQGIAGSGLSQEQIRARLVAQGYPAGLLDAYLGTSTPTTQVPSADVFAAVRSLGLFSASDLEELMRLAGTTVSRSASGARVDSMPAPISVAQPCVSDRIGPQVKPWTRPWFSMARASRWKARPGRARQSPPSGC